MKQDLSSKKTFVDFGDDSVVVRKFINGILGGVMLDYAGFTESSVLAGHCVITDGDGHYKPMPLAGDVYGQMPEGYHYAGVVYRSAMVKDPVSVMYRGVVNKYKVPYPFKGDFDVPGIIIGCDVEEEDPYARFTPVDDIAALPSGDEARSASVSIGAVINEFASQDYFGNILVADAEVDKNVTVKALGKVIIDNVTIAGGKEGVNGKVSYAAKELQLKNITAKADATLYNAFEGYQRTNDPDYKGVEKVIAEHLDIDCPSITHNIINVYTPAEGAEIIIRNSRFNLTVDNSNVLRLANYFNVENVKVTFENCEWTYENGLSFNDWKWAGLAIYQPAASDIALGGDTSKLATWKFRFRNCRYNGVKVTENGFGEHSQVLYLYNIGGNNKVEDPVEIVEGIDVTFE